MSSSNGHPTAEVSTLREQAEAARLRHEIAGLARETRLLEWWGNAWGNQGLSGWNGWPNPYDMPPGPDGWGMAQGMAGRLDATKDGSNKPFIWYDIDLDRARGLARWIATDNHIATGAVECIADYTVRTGYQYEAKPKKRYIRDGTARELAAMVQEVLEEHQSLNQLGETASQQTTWADRERETVTRDVVDGEVFLRTFCQPDGSTWIRFIEPEQVRKPLGSPPEWDFGRRHAPNDIERIISTCVQYDPTRPDEWEEVPDTELLHLKSNARSCVKRGLSDFFGQTGAGLDGVLKLLEAMRIGGQAMANIAWVEEHEGASQAALDALVAKRRDQTTQQPPNPLTGRDEPTQKSSPGQRLLVGGNRKYVTGPLASNTQNFVAIAGACLRSLGNRWRMPEYMISGDASNANYASTLVSGSPFVTRVECRQAVYGRFFLRVLWIVVRNAARYGRFLVNGHRFTWDEIVQMVEIVPTPPQVAIADKAVEGEVDNQDIQNGVMSLQTRRHRRGLDSDTETENIKKEPVKKPDQPPPGGAGGLLPAMEGQREPLYSRLVQLRETYGDLLAGDITTAATRILEDAAVKNKTGPGWHDPKTGKPAPAPDGGDQGGGDNPEKKSLLSRVAGKVSAAIQKGVSAALEAIDNELRGGGSLIAQGLRSLSPSMVMYGITRAITSAYGMGVGSMGDTNDAMEETFEAAMAQHSFGGAHAVGVIASKALAAGERALQSGVRKLLAKVGIVRESLETESEQELPKDLHDFFFRIARQSAREIKAAILDALGIEVKEGPATESLEGILVATVLLEAAVKNASGPGWHDSQTGKPAPAPKISSAELPKTTAGVFFKSEQLHDAAADPTLEKQLRSRLSPKDKGKFDALMVKLRDQHAASQQGGQATGSGSAPAAHQEAVLTAFRKLDKGGDNLVLLADLRDELARQGLGDRGEQDAAINELRKANRMSGTGIEGRHAISNPAEHKRQMDAAIKDGSQTLGYLMLRR